MQSVSLLCHIVTLYVIKEYRTHVILYALHSKLELHKKYESWTEGRFMQLDDYIYKKSNQSNHTYVRENILVSLEAYIPFLLCVPSRGSVLFR